MGLVLAALPSGFFLDLGYWASHYRGDNNFEDSGLITSEWVGGPHSSLHEQNFACPETGRLVANIWESDEGWTVRIHTEHYDDPDLHAAYKDEAHGKHAAEEFVKKYHLCEKYK